MSESTFRYNTSGNWYKGNTHLHTTISDGGESAAEAAEMYAVAGYDFLFITDHKVVSNVERDNPEPPLLLMDGVELDGKTETGAWYHVVCLGVSDAIPTDISFRESLEAARSQDAMLILAHPHWCDNTLDDATDLNVHGVEIYNHICHWLNGKSNGLVHWGAMLKQNIDVLGFASDDAHLKPEHPPWGGGWIVVNAPNRTKEHVMAAIKSGNFYSSCGPDFKSIKLEDNCVTVRTSEVQVVRLVGPGSCGQRLGLFNGERITEATIEIPESWDYAYLEIEDDTGHRAWSNTLFVDTPHHHCTLES
jgi:hypothetical protein